MAKQDDWVRMTLRLPASLHARLEKIVENGPHSLNAEIVHRLRDSLEDTAITKMLNDYDATVEPHVRVGFALDQIYDALMDARATFKKEYGADALVERGPPSDESEPSASHSA